jgi:hypothetical protein
MTGGGTVYFTAKAVADTGEESVLSPAYAWVVPWHAGPAAPSGGIIKSEVEKGNYTKHRPPFCEYAKPYNLSHERPAKNHPRNQLKT